MYRVIILLLTLLALAAIGYFCLHKIQAPAIQADIQSRTIDALRSNGIEWAEVSVSGRDITLSGVAPSEEMRQAASRIARVEGYNVLANNSRLIGEPTGDSQLAVGAFSLKINKQQDGRMILDGVLDKNAKADLLAIAKEQYGIDNIVDKVVVVGGATTASAFTNTIGNALEKMNGLTEAEALITTNNVFLSGKSPSKMMLQQIQQQLQATIPASMQSEFNLELADVPAGVAGISNNRSGLVPPLSRKECQKRFDQALKKRIQFNRSSAVIKPGSYAALDNIANIAKQCNTQRIVVHGHTDASGRNAANRRLSKKRAQAVVNYLIQKDIEPSRFKAVGHGSSKPIASNKTKRGRASNRRIELSVEVKK